MLIGLSGKAGSGKDTVFERIREVAIEMGYPEPERIAFADPLKESVCNLLKINRDQVEYYKNSPGGGHLTILGQPMSMREFLQRYGTESHRDVFGEDFWVEASLPYGFVHSGKIVVVTDVRFPNERDRISTVGGETFVVIGAEEIVVGDVTGDHSSESGVSGVMRVIDNTSRDSFDALDDQIRLILGEFSYEVGIGETGEPTKLEVVEKT